MAMENLHRLRQQRKCDEVSLHFTVQFILVFVHTAKKENKPPANPHCSDAIPGYTLKHKYDHEPSHSTSASSNLAIFNQSNINKENSVEEQRKNK